MTRVFGTIITALIISSISYSQTDEIWHSSDLNTVDTMSINQVISEDYVINWLNEEIVNANEKLVGGYVQSIFREGIDSAKVLLYSDGDIVDSTFTEEGFFKLPVSNRGQVLDIRVHHSDFHAKDTSFVFPKDNKSMIWFDLDPRYKILLRGRAYAGNMPLEGVDVLIQQGTETYNLRTRGCYYDKEDYWNCLYDGMFKLELTADNADDSICISLNREGMKSMRKGMTFNEYSGEIMQLKMSYESVLPKAPMNCINLKLAFPFMSMEEDWFVSLSYHRLVNDSNWRRLAYGIDANMYISNLSILHNTFDGVEPSQVDSSYIRAFVGPSAKYWFVAPENRIFSSYIGTTLALNLTDYTFTPQAFMGSRIFLDLNKAINLEVRYTEYDMDVVHYTFNRYGGSEKYYTPKHFMKLHAVLGIQIVF